MRFIKYFLVSLLCLALLVVGIAYFSTRNTKTGTLSLQGLKGEVIIQRDQYGVPHIHALKSDEDAFFALGYAHAQDRLWQMEFQRRVAAGRLSEILGDKTLEMDKFLRTMGFYRAAKTAWPALDEKTKRIIHSYVQGINAFLATGRLPLQFKILRFTPEPWTDIDGFCWSKMMAFDLQQKWKQKITNFQIKQALGEKRMLALLPDYPQNAPTVLSYLDLVQTKLLTSHPTIDKTLFASPTPYPHFNRLKMMADRISRALGFTSPPGKGSNNWVVSGDFSASHEPLLANDPHLSLGAPALWYLAELQGPSLHVIGGTLPGLPSVAIGHNDHIAWGVTNVDPNADELYIEPEGTKLTTINEVIKVKGQPDIHLPIRFSSHGPIISDISDAKKIGPTVALKWVALAPNDTTVQSFIKINYARNWNEFTNALKDFVTPSQNFIYADTDNNIGYYVPGHIPIRKGWDSSFPVPADQAHEWSGFIPFESLPHALNPAKGYIVTANNKVIPDAYPFEITFRWREPPYRAKRIIDLINTTTAHSVDTFAAMQNDTIDYLWRDLRPILLQTHPLDADSKKALEILSTWDGNTSLNSQAASIFNYWFRELSQMPSDLLPFIKYWREPLFIKAQLKKNSALCKFYTNDSCKEFQSETLQSAMKALTHDHGHNPAHWTWGNVHQAVFKELILGKVKWLGWIWNQSIETPGDFYTVNVGTYEMENFQQTNGAGYRQIVDLHHLNNSKFIQALGQTDDPFDAHHNDLMKLWRDGRYLPMSNDPAMWGDIQELRLEPKSNG